MDSSQAPSSTLKWVKVWTEHQQHCSLVINSTAASHQGTNVMLWSYFYLLHTHLQMAHPDQSSTAKLVVDAFCPQIFLD